MKKSINPVWGGRFEEKPSDLLQKINNSIGFDYKLALHDIKLNLEYSKSLKKAKIISDVEYVKIKNALIKINKQLKSGKLEFSSDFEDIHMNIEMLLKEKIGSLSGKIHTGKSRNDQVVTDLKLWTKEKLEVLFTNIFNIQKTILQKVEVNIDVVMQVLHICKMLNRYYSHITCYLSLRCLKEIKEELKIFKKRLLIVLLEAEH